MVDCRLIEVTTPKKPFETITIREKEFFSFRSIGSKKERVLTRAGLPDRTALELGLKKQKRRNLPAFLALA